jgi:hypothetical protein
MVSMWRCVANRGEKTPRLWRVKTWRFFLLYFLGNEI